MFSKITDSGKPVVLMFMLDIFNFIFFSIIGNTALFNIDSISDGTPGKTIRIILFLSYISPLAEPISFGSKTPLSGETA